MPGDVPLLSDAGNALSLAELIGKYDDEDDPGKYEVDILWRVEAVVVVMEEQV